MSAPRSKQAIERTKALAVKVSADGRNVELFSSGKPFFWLGDTAWETFHRLTKEQVLLYLDNRAAKGYNVAMMVITPEHGPELPNVSGEYTFEPLPESTKEEYVPDVSKPNAKYFDFVDWVVDAAAERGILVAIVPTWGKFVNYGYYPQQRLWFDEKSIETLGEYLGQRYPYNPFILGGDSNRYWSQNTITTVMAGGDAHSLPVHDCGPAFESLAAALAKSIKAIDADYTPFMTYHPASCWLPNTPKATSSQFFPEADWLSMDVIQSGHMDGAGLQGGDFGGITAWRAKSSYIPVRLMYEQKTKDGKPRPVMDLEGHYESTPQGFDYKNPYWSAVDIRNGTHQAVFSGACGITYGCNSIWQMHNPHSLTHPGIVPPTTAKVPWYDELDLPGASQCAIIQQLVTSMPDFAARVPDQSIVTSETHEGKGDELICSLRSSKGLWALIYTPKGEAVTVDLDKAVGGKLHRAEWHNPRDGKRTPIEGAGPTFTPPSSGTLNDDWVLVLHA